MGAVRGLDCLHYESVILLVAGTDEAKGISQENQSAIVLLFSVYVHLIDLLSAEVLDHRGRSVGKAVADRVACGSQVVKGSLGED